MHHIHHHNHNQPLWASFMGRKNNQIIMTTTTTPCVKVWIRSFTVLLFAAGLLMNQRMAPRRLSSSHVVHSPRAPVQVQQEKVIATPKMITVPPFIVTRSSDVTVGSSAKDQARRKRNAKLIQELSLNNTYGLPPLTSLIGDLHQNITGNVQFLLDFAIVGFGKCGTTALISWLDNQTEINTIPKEALHLARHRPALLAQALYEMKLNELQQESERHSIELPTISQQHRPTRLQGFKNPSDIRRPQSMAYLRQYWPQTKMIITVRHPVHWFQSLYNYLVNEMRRPEKYLKRQSMIGGPHRDTAYAHTGKGEFHAILSLLGKTEMISDDELELLKGFLQEDELDNWPQPLPNPIFFVETTQMSDPNETRAALFRQDLQHFLGLQQELPPILHVRPRLDRQLDDAPKIDMCAPDNLYIRQELMRISRKASSWIRTYFLASEDVTVSSRDYLQEIFATAWMQDPCDDQNKLSR
jgi:hypothetical protein